MFKTIENKNKKYSKRNNETKQVIKNNKVEFDIEKISFPVLSNNDEKKTVKSNLKYTNLLFDDNEKLQTISSTKKENDKYVYLKCRLKKDKLNSDKVIYIKNKDNYDRIQNKYNNNEKIFTNIMNSMINRWQNKRDNLNDLLGEMSPYYNEENLWEMIERIEQEEIEDNLIDTEEEQEEIDNYELDDY